VSVTRFLITAIACSAAGVSAASCLT